MSSRTCCERLALVGMAIAAFGLARAQADTPPCDVARAELRALDQALELYRSEHGSYPSAADWLGTLGRQRLIRKDTPSTDPWGFAWHYEPQPTRVSLGSVGPDGVWGTSDDQSGTNDFAWTTCTPKRHWAMPRGCTRW